MESDRGYRELIDAILQKELSILGPDVTLRKARGVPGLVISDDFKTKEFQGGLETIEALVDGWKSLSGTIAITFVREAIKPVLKDYPNLPVPAELTGDLVTASNELQRFITGF